MNVTKLLIVIASFILENIAVYTVNSFKLKNMEYILFSILIIILFILVLSRIKLSAKMISGIVILIITINIFLVFEIVIPQRQKLNLRLNSIKMEFENIDQKKNNIKEIHIFKGPNFKIKISNRNVIKDFIAAIKTSYQLNGISSKMIDYYRFSFVFNNNDKYSFYFGKDISDADCSSHKYKICNMLFLIDIPEIDAFNNDRWPDMYRFSNYECDELVPLIIKYVDKKIADDPEKTTIEIQ